MSPKLTSIKPLVIIATGVVLLILLLTIFGSILLKKEQKPLPAKEYIPPEPSQTNPVKLPQAPTFQDELSKIKPLLPYRENNYSIEYLEAGNILSVKITAESAQIFTETKNQVEQFIKSKGVQDICTLNIFWVPLIDQQVRKSLDPKNLITTGCKP